MFCSNCGSKPDPDARFCNECGTAIEVLQPQVSQPPPVTQPGYPPTQAQHTVMLPGYAQQAQAPHPAPQPGYQQPQYTQPPQQFTHPTAPSPGYPVPNRPVAKPAKSKKKSKLLIAIAGCFLVLIFSAVGVFGFTLLNNPSLAVSRAMGNVAGEFNERLETTPFQAFGMLMNTLENGTVNVGFDYRRQWTDWWSGDARTETADGSFSLSSNARTGDYALTGRLRFDGGSNLHLSAHINSERIAFNSPQASRDYYGFTFSTFRQDFRHFGQNVLRMSNSEIDMIVSYVEMIENSLDQSDASEMFEPYIEAFTAFLLDAYRESTRGVEVRAGLQTVSTRRVDYVITAEAVVALLTDWFNLFDRDSDMQNMLFNSWGMAMGSNTQGEMVNELWSVIREIDRHLRGDATLSFYVGNRNRLVRVTTNGHFSFDGDSISFRADINFGASATDTWTIDASVTDRWGTNDFRGSWDMRTIGGVHEHTLSGTAGQNTIYLRSDWNPNSGAFSLRYTETGSWGTHSGDLLDGNFTVNGNDFRLRFNFDNDWDTVVNIEIDTSQRSEAGSNVNFVNIDRWDQAFLDRWEDAFDNVGGFGGSNDAPTPVTPPASN